MAKHVGDTTGVVIAPSVLRFVCVGPKRRWHTRGMACMHEF